MTGVRASEQDFRREAGIGSSEELLDCDCEIDLCMKSSDRNKRSASGIVERIIGHRYRTRIEFSAKPVFCLRKTYS